MAQRIVLLTPARRFIANRFGLGYQIPLGLVLLGGPLVDAGHEVKLIDNDLYGWSLERLVAEIAQFRADWVMLGHTGSTAAHPACLATAEALRAAFPELRLVYGGVYPSYAAESILLDCPAIDVIVRGEAEQTVLNLVAAWEGGRSLAQVPGITWRDGASIRANRSVGPLQNLDQYRPGWELVDWPGYKLFGIGRSAGIQFSRGCPLTCTYCGQWLFWKRWRRRSPQNFVAELKKLAQTYGVKIVWLADENFAADREVVQEVLERLVEADLDLSLNVNMTAADVVRDADLLPLYKAAGVDYVVMGVESLEDEVVRRVRKNNPFQVSKEAIRLLRQHQIISLVNIIYGLEDETPATIKAKFWKLCELDPDILNAVYLTPHFWTASGRTADPADIIQLDQARWTYRNQVMDTPQLSPSYLFWGVKATETLFHLRPRALGRLWGSGRMRQILRSSMAVGVKVIVAEVGEFLGATSFAPKGSLAQLPGMAAKGQPASKSGSFAPEPGLF